jgi:hypothetical protein
VGSLSDPGIALRPIIASTGNQPDAIPVPLDANAKAVMFDFVEPLWPSRDLGCGRWQAELERLKHAPKKGIRSGFC